MKHTTIFQSTVSRLTNDELDWLNKARQDPMTKEQWDAAMRENDCLLNFFLAARDDGEIRAWAATRRV